jgi:hypothetical protein
MIESKKRGRIASLAAVAAALALSTFLAAAAAPSKPRVNYWLSLYDFAQRKGTLYTLTGKPYRQLDFTYGKIRVPTTVRGFPISENTCHIDIGLCPDDCKKIAGFNSLAFLLAYDDRGCTGQLANLRYAPSANAKGRDYKHPMERWLTPPIFDYLGLLYLQHVRKLYRTD